MKRIIGEILRTVEQNKEVRIISVSDLTIWPCGQVFMTTNVIHNFPILSEFKVIHHHGLRGRAWNEATSQHIGTVAIATDATTL